MLTNMSSNHLLKEEENLVELARESQRLEAEGTKELSEEDGWWKRLRG